MSDTLIEAVGRLARFAAAWGRPCALVGGSAIIARVRSRYTDDLDLAIEVPAGDVDALLDLARRHGYDYDETETRELLEGGLLRLWGPPDRAHGIGLDLLFVDSPFLRLVVRRAVPVEMGGVTIPVATPEDLLLMKIEANRPSDWDDAIAIKDAFEETLDRGYLQEQADHLGLLDRLRSLLGAGA